MSTWAEAVANGDAEPAMSIMTIDPNDKDDLDQAEYLREIGQADPGA